MAEKFRILVFAHDSSLYGASKSLLTLVDYWKKNNPEVEVLLLLPYKGTLEEHLINSDINFKIVNFPRANYKYNNQSVLDVFKLRLKFFLHERTAIKKISEIIKVYQPNIIYTNTSVVGIGNKIADIFKIPALWHIREFGWSDYRLKYLPTEKLHNKKIRSSNTIFVSKALQNYWIGDTTTKESQVVYNGFIDKKIGPPTKEVPDKIIIGILGAIMPGKGQLQAIEAVDILNKRGIPVTLEIYGHAFDKTYDNELKALLENNEDMRSYIKFCGFNDNPDEIYNHISIMLNCSKSEGFGRSIVEAMISGIPVVANNAGAIPEIITNEFNGLLYDSTSSSLAEKLEILINNKILWKNITQNAFNFAVENYTVEKYANSVLDFLKKISNGNK